MDSTPYMKLALYDLYEFQPCSKLVIFNSIASDFNLWAYGNTQKTSKNITIAGIKNLLKIENATADLKKEEFYNINPFLESSST